MHESALISGIAFADTYCKSGQKVLDIGGLNINGSLRKYFIERGMNYICVDIEEHKSVDIVVIPGEKLPFDDGTIDIIISTSCFEHDPCFWLTFKEMTRILKLKGYIYVNAPGNGYYHAHPGDNWRFYSDAGQALAYWSGIQIANEIVYPVKVVETFHILPKKASDIWTDFVCVWERTEQKETDILTQKDIINTVGNLESKIIKEFKISKKCFLPTKKIKTKKKILMGLFFYIFLCYVYCTFIFGSIYDPHNIKCSYIAE